MGAKHPEHSIVAIENGHVTGRKVGDGASHVVLEQVRQPDSAAERPLDLPHQNAGREDIEVFIPCTSAAGAARSPPILGINYDISSLLMVEDAVHELIDTKDKTQSEPEKDRELTTTFLG